MREKNSKELYKIAVFGQPGRDALIERLVTGKYTDAYISYITTSDRVATLSDGIKCIFQKAINDRFATISSCNDTIHYGTSAYIIAFDSTDPTVKAQISKQMIEINRKMKNNVPIILVGTMADKGVALVPSQEIEEFSQELAETYNKDISYFGSTSSKEQTNISEFFEYVLNKIRPVPILTKDCKSTLNDIKYDLSAEKGCKQAFLDKHAQLFKRDKEGFFSCFRNTNMNSNNSLGELLKYAKENDNRSREAFRALGWMNLDGSLTKQAPEPVKNTVLNDENKPLF